VGYNKKPRVAGLMVACAAAMFALPENAAGEIEEIIVTTRYKEESLQEVPIAVTAVGVEAIERRAIDDLFKVADLDPSVSFDTSFGPGDTRVSIRGLSNTRGRSNVAFLVDGVDVTSENQIAAGSGLLANQRLLADIERIEIVKGPQSALYGRAAFAGAIAYTTKNPEDQLTGTMSVNVAEDSEYQLRGAFSGPLTDTLGFRLDGIGWTDDGYYRNRVSGASLGGGEGWGSSFKLVWDPTDAFSLSTRVAYSEDENDPRPVTLVQNDEFRPFNDAATAAGIGVGAPFGSDTDVPPDGIGNGYRLGQVNHGTFCPDLGVVNDGNPLDPDFANTLPGVAPGTPGICRPGNLGSVSDLPNGKNSIRHSETLLGEEQEGSTLDLFRTSVNATWDTGNGLFTFIGGYTEASQTDEHDQDFSARGRPDRLGTNDPFFDYGGNLTTGHQQADTDTDTRQVSAELRFATDFDGPVNATVGYLRWDLKVQAEDRNFIANCLPTVADLDPGTENAITGLPTISDLTVANICDGGNVSYLIGNEFFNGDTYNNWQQYMQQFLVTGATAGFVVDPRGTTVLEPGRIPGAFWQSDTNHESIYLQVDWDINEELKLTAEARYVDERFQIERPNQSSCSNLAIGYGFNSGGGTTTLPLGGSWVIEGSGTPIPPFPGFPGVNVTPDLNCSSVNGRATFDFWDTIGDGFSPMLDDDGQPVLDANGQRILVRDPDDVGVEDDSFLAPKVTLEWFWDEGKMAYFSWAKARKPGGINQLAAGGSAVTIDDLRFDAERMTTWELGTKSTWDFAGSLTTNAALFFNDYTDKQVSTQIIDSNGSLQPRVLNASSAEVLGVELDMTWLPAAIDGLLIRAAYTWQDGEYKNFLDRSSSAIRAGWLEQCDVVTVGGETRCQFDLSGKALERQAENAFSASFSYTQAFGDSGMDWFLEGDTSFQDKRFVDQDNYVFFDDYWLTNFRLGLETDTWDALIFVDNAFDDDTIRSGGSGPEFSLQSSRLGFTAGLGVNGYFGILPDPRTIGLRTNFRFGG